MSFLRYIKNEVQWCVIMLMIHCFAICQASAATSPDSTHFVTASLIVISPGNELYSVFGHCVLHMQCPSKDLDYVYTFETEPNYLKFFAGKSKACFVAVPTQEFLQQYKAEGRGVTEYALNLTPHEKQELWRALDEDMEEGPTRRFTMLKSNCVSMSLFMVEQVLEKRYIDFSPNNWLLRMGNARVLHSCLRHSPWADFIFFTFSGSEADKCWTVEELLSPATVGPCLQSDHIAVPEVISVGRSFAVSHICSLKPGPWSHALGSLPMSLRSCCFCSLWVSVSVDICAIKTACSSLPMPSFFCCRPSSVVRCFMSALLPTSSVVAGTGISFPSTHYPS